MQNLLSDFGAKNPVYLKNLKPWLQKSKFNLVFCHVSIFYTLEIKVENKYIEKPEGV
jgi:hypothetical protein